MSKIEDDIKLSFDDVLIKPKWSRLDSRADVDLIRKFKLCNSGYEWEGLPIIVANMDTVGTIGMAAAFQKHRACVAIHKYVDTTDLADLLKFEQRNNYQTSWVTIGYSDDELERLNEINKIVPVERIVVDVANGYIESFCDFLCRVRDQYPKSAIMAGNITTTDILPHYIVNCGVDIIKIGIGPGAMCTTRKVTGVGYGQLSAIMECSDVAHGLNSHICADGGIKFPGDLCKSIGAGADFTMIGSLFAATDESYGTWRHKQKFHQPICYGSDLDQLANGQYYLKVYGMSSRQAQEKLGEIKEYRASEGRCEYIKYKGSAGDVLKELMGGLRSCCTYVGASRLKDLSKCTTFVRIK